jgi:hypothetical protein
MMMHDMDDCSVEVEKRLDRILLTSDLAERSRLLGEAVAWHQLAVNLSLQSSPVPRAGGEVIPFRPRSAREGGDFDQQ